MGKASETKLRIGVLSDIHITDEASTPIFHAALAYFRDQGVDGVVIAGDLADRGRRDELQLVESVWSSVFPKDSPVAKLFVYGNHDHPKLGAADWQAVFGTDYAPVSLVRVKGFAFVLNNLLQGTDEVDAFFAAHADELKREKLFFYVQHFHPQGTCSAPWVWGQDDGRSTKLLAQFPNCVAFSGHSHASLTDDRTIRQGVFGFTSVGTAALRDILPFGGRENASIKGVPELQDKQMPDLLAGAARDAHQALLVSVFDDRLTLTRYDVGAQAPLGADWVLPRDGSQTLAYEVRAKAAPVPQFAKGATVTAAEVEGVTRRGKKAAQVVVKFPPALTGARAFDYEVRAVKREADLVQIARTKRVYSPAYFRAPMCEPAEVACVFARDELPWMLPFKFEVRPLNCWGVAGEPIVSQYVTLADDAASQKQLKAGKSAQKRAKAEEKGASK